MARRRTVRSDDPAAARIAAAIRRTRAGLALERALRAFWPLGTLIAAAWAALAFGLAEAAPQRFLLGVVAVAAIAALALLVLGLRRFRWPSRSEAEARLDAVLPGRPLAALGDRPGLGRDDAGALAVWAAHVARMRRIAAQAAWVPPDLRLARFDPRGLRLMALVALGAALLFARADPIAGLGAAIAGAGGGAAAGPSYEAWAEPPGYTGRPTLYLPDAPPEPPLVVPQGTEITVRVYGDAGDFALTQSVADADAPLAEAASGIAAARFTVDRSGEVALSGERGALGSWSFVMQPDAAPEIDIAEPLGRAPTGETRLSYVARDDHGVVAAQAQVTLDLAATERVHGLSPEPQPREALVIDLPLPMSKGSAQEIAETLVEDFSRHPWSGLPVRIRLTAEDALGQAGVREGIAAVLPGRRFYNPVAAALVEQRRDLLWTTGNARRVAQVLRALTWRPEGTFRNEKAYLATRIAIRRLDVAAVRPDNVAQVEEVAEMLWKVALLLEEGSLGDAAERLARAQERLREALRNDASDEEIAQLMDELRQATQHYMQQLAEEALRDGERQRAEGPPPGQTMSQDQIQQLMDRIQELSEQGRRAEAEALLEMLRQLLENMEMQFAEGGQGGAGQGQQSMQGLGDALREQQGLADDSFEDLQRQFREGRGGRQGEGEAGQGRALAERQRALRELMEELQRGLPGEAGDAARDALRRAERDMGEAEGSLREDDTAGALDEQSEAIENLREGMRQMARDMRRAAGSQNGEPGAEGEARADGRNDPLGRPLGSDGSTGSGEQMVPEADAGARARGLFDEIRRRSGDRSRPQLELDYLRRLLDRF